MGRQFRVSCRRFFGLHFLTKRGKKMLKYLVNRFKEPSSQAGIAALAIAFGLPPTAANLGVQVVAGVCGLVAFFKPEAVK